MINEFSTRKRLQYECKVVMITPHSFIDGCSVYFLETLFRGFASADSAWITASCGRTFCDAASWIVVFMELMKYSSMSMDGDFLSPSPKFALSKLDTDRTTSRTSFRSNSSSSSLSRVRSLK